MCRRRGLRNITAAENAIHSHKATILFLATGAPRNSSETEKRQDIVFMDTGSNIGKNTKKLVALFEKRVILSAGAMLIFSVSFQIDHCEFVSWKVESVGGLSDLQCP